jgi:hypothetical protein
LGTPNSPPPPAITDVAEDSTGLVWVFVRVAAPTWREAWPAVGGEFDYRQMSLDKMFRTMVEVIDPGRQSVVTRTVLNQWVVSALPGSRVASYLTNEDGSVHIRIEEFGLRRPESPLQRRRTGPGRDWH